MSTLIVHECTPEITQEFVPTANINLAAIRPHLYIHGAPSGKIKLELRDENNRKISESESFTITDLKTLDYAHGYYRFYIGTPLQKDQTYILAIVCFDGYSFSESAWVGVCKDWDNEKTNQTYSDNDDYKAPLDFEIWERNSDMRELNFSDSFESSSAPTEGQIDATGFAEYANDAAYEAAKGSSGVGGDAYYNTTINAIRFHNGTGWFTADRIDTLQNSFSIGNNQSNQDVTNLAFDGDEETSVVIQWEIQRSDDSPTNVAARGTTSMSFKNGTWTTPETEFSGDNPGMTFGVDNQAGNVGQIQYTSTNFPGGSYTGTMKYEVRVFTV